MASEDSDQLGSGFLAVHGCNHLKKIRKTAMAEVMAFGHPRHAIRELLKIELLRRPQRMLPKERDDHAQKVGTLRHLVVVKGFPVIVVTGVLVDGSHSEEGLQGR